MLAIKLKMVGRKNQRTFRVIVQEARSKLGGKFVEDLGWYNPHTNQYKINKNRVDYWLGNGAQPTETVGRILKKAQTSETETYETREGRKKKKAPKGDKAPAIEASTGEEPTVNEERAGEAPVEVTEEKTEDSAATSAEEPKAESDDSAPTEESEEKQEDEKKEEEPPAEKSQEEITSSNEAGEENKSETVSDAKKPIEEKKENE